MAESRWLADEMLGRLARYLRFLGHDTEYVRGATDAEISDRARSENRRLLTRDRLLAQAVPSAILLESPHLREQLRELRERAPETSFDIRFDRCTLCNGALRPSGPPTGSPRPPGPQDGPADLDRPTFVCERCGHRYWEGSHTAHIRRQLAEWLGP
ncbi:MAG: DUF5615 family PIN-like protein [Thermoplasmata archaeon]|nr:DUF5615 family PIN-like protein [Thermoplasmata archaeon]